MNFFEKIRPYSNLETEISETNSSEIITGDELLNMEIDNYPTLLDPIFPKVGLIALAGSSDTGKSSFLRQFAIHVASGMDNFLGFNLDKKHRSAIVFSTEDDKTAISYLLNKQNMKMKFPSEAFNNLRYVFEAMDPVAELDRELNKKPADVVIIDTFTDIYRGEMNATNRIRCFLNDYSRLAQQHETLFIFLHHTGKGKDKLEPSKHNLLGSQGFEAKMRLVMELRKDQFNPDYRHLCVVKGNYLPEEFKNESFLLEFDENMLFHNRHERIPFEELVQYDSSERKYNKEENLTKTKELLEQGFNQSQIAEELGVNKGTVSRYMKEIP
jgi:RecA-family ATPase